MFLLFYLAGGMGAGDVKLMAGVSVLVGLSHVGEVLIATALLGGVFAMVLAVVQGTAQSGGGEHRPDLRSSRPDRPHSPSRT